MDAKEFLLKKFNEMIGGHFSSNMEFYANPSIARIDPFKIADGLYYVGDKRVCIHLIDTGEGLILIDSGYFGAAHLLVDSIWRAGFDPKNVKWIIHTHGHYDHFGASDEFKRMYGTKLAISKVDAQGVKEKPCRALVNNELFHFARIPEFDREIEDGEIFELGNVKIRFVLTPGHTDGVLSLFFNVTYEGKTYLAGLFGGAGTNALTLPYICYDEASEDRPQQMLNSIKRVWDEDVVIHLGNHPENNKTLEKREKQIREGGNPFVAPDSWHEFLTNLKETVGKSAESNEALKHEMEQLA